MQIRYLDTKGIRAAVLEQGVIGGVPDALDLIGTAFFNGAANVIIPQHLLTEHFFVLKTKVAGDILQKFVNYEMRLAIVGDFSGIQSDSLACFIRESNKGRHVFFKSTQEEAIDALAALAE